MVDRHVATEWQPADVSYINFVRNHLFQWIKRSDTKLLFSAQEHEETYILQDARLLLLWDLGKWNA